jgi:hypothetical protein
MSVPQDTAVSVTVVFMVPGRLGSSNAASYTTRWPGTSSWYFPPNEWLWPLPKAVNDMRQTPPTTGSMLCTLPVNPKGGSQRSKALGSVNAR